MKPLQSSAVLLGRSALTLGRRGGEVRPDAAPTRFEAAPLDAAYLAAYRDYTGSAAVLPALYPLAQRAQLARLLAPGFPLALPGMIHVANSLTALGAIDPSRAYSLDVTAGPAEEGRVEVIVGLFQAGVAVAECRSLYQGRGRKSAGGVRREPPAEPAESPIAEATWTLGADEGRRYAALSGDWNPIHLWPWSAKPFGFGRPILHGMAAVGRVAGLLESRTGRRVVSVSVRFRRPMPLPGELRLAAWEERFRVTSEDGSLHLDGDYVLEGGIQSNV